MFFTSCSSDDFVDPFVLKVRRNASSSSEESSKSFHLTAREYVESLHQNSKNTLLYGKNNVLVQAVSKVSINRSICILFLNVLKILTSLTFTTLWADSADNKN